MITKNKGLFLTVLAGGSIAVGQPLYTETEVDQGSVERNGVSGSGVIQATAFDSGEGRRVLEDVGFVVTVLSDSRIEGTVNHPPFSGGAQAEARAELLVDGVVRLNAPSTLQVTLPVSNDGTVYSAGTSGFPPRPGSINLFDRATSFVERVPGSFSNYIDTGTWNSTLSWSLSTEFDRQEGPNQWQFTDRSTTVNARVTTTYIYSIDSSTIDTDFNKDGDENMFDLIDVLASFDQGETSVDFTLDGMLSPDDVFEFIRAE